MDPRETILGLYPKARITSGRRDPNSALGRANPRSYHNIGRAYDFAPIPGVQFDDFVSSIRNAGVNVVEARDEVTNPSRHATGPHWHIAYGDNKPMRRPDPITRSLMPNYLQMSQPQGGVDPLAPQQPLQQPLGAGMGMMQPAPQPNFAAMSQPSGGADPLAPTKGPSKGMKILGTIAGILGDSLAAYGGRQGVYAPMMANLQEQEAEDRRFREKLAAEQSYRAQEAEAKRLQPYRITNSAGDQIEIDPSTGQQRVVYADPYGKQQWQRVENPATGAVEIVNNGATPRPNENHLRHLLSTGDKKNFDAKFGPGMADYYLQQYGGR